MEKDYYKILQVANTANEQEIKKSYRQLVMKLHPDKNQENPVAQDHFREVQEAYEVLSHPAKRSAYNQQRWYRYSSKKQYDNRVVTGYSILQKSTALNNYLSTLDSFHINTIALANYIMQILSNGNIKILETEDVKSMNNAIINELIQAANFLPLQASRNVAMQLVKLAGNDTDLVQFINKFVKDKKLSHYWEQFLPVTVLAVSIVICLLIYFVSSPSS